MTRSRILLLSALLVLAAAPGCSEFFTDPWQWGTVEVTIVPEDGGPMPDLELRLFTGTRILGIGEPDEAGNHTFTHVPSGPMGVSVTAFETFVDPQYQFTTFRMEEGERRELSFTVDFCVGTIRALVVDPDGVPIEGAGLRLYRSSGPVETRTTGPDGRQEFSNIECWDYGVRVLPPEGYHVEEGPGQSYFDRMVVEKGSEFDIVFTLFPA